MATFRTIQRRARIRKARNALKRQFKKLHIKNIDSRVPSEMKLIRLINEEFKTWTLRQMRVGFYFADIFIPDRLLVVEVDGDSHLCAKQIYRDRKKDALIRAAGLRILRVTNEEVDSNWGGIKEKIEQFPIIPNHIEVYERAKGYMGAYFGSSIKKMAKRGRKSLMKISP